nr:hypothetical protein [Chloroflexaceae bacterium]
MARVEVIVLGRAVAVIRQMIPTQRAQFDRLIAAMRLSPQAGVFYGYDLEQRVLRQVSAADVHIIYTITYRQQGERLFVVAVEIAEWTPKHSDMP